jgi:hypothetical protein
MEPRRQTVSLLLTFGFELPGLVFGSLIVIDLSLASVACYQRPV